MSSKFICDLFSREEANVIVFGVPIGKDSEKVLDSLRKASDLVEPFDLERKRNLLENVRIADLGNLRLETLEEVTKKCEEILKKSKFPLIIGRGHLFTLYSLRAFNKDVKVLVFDAHSDLKDEYLDSIMTSYYGSIVKKESLPRMNGATWLRRFCESRKNEVALIGIRSCDEDEFEYMKRRNILYFTPTQIRKKIRLVKKRLSEFTRNSEVYVSVDIDVFDPSIAPAVEYPEPNGLFFHEFVELIEAFEGKLVGMDLNCQKFLPNNQTTEFLATRVVFEVLNLLQK